MGQGSLVWEIFQLAAQIASCIISIIRMFVVMIHNAVQEHRAKQEQQERQREREAVRIQRDLERGDGYGQKSNDDRKPEMGGEVHYSPQPQNVEQPPPSLPQMPAKAYLQQPPTSPQSAPPVYINV
jgi:hypothetical protein